MSKVHFSPVLRPLQILFPLGCAATILLPFPFPSQPSSPRRTPGQHYNRVAVVGRISLIVREMAKCNFYVRSYKIYTGINLSHKFLVAGVLNGHPPPPYPLFAPSAWCAHFYVRASPYLLLRACPTAYCERCFVGTRTSLC